MKWLFREDDSFAFAIYGKIFSVLGICQQEAVNYFCEDSVNAGGLVARMAPFSFVEWMIGGCQEPHVL